MLTLIVLCMMDSPPDTRMLRCILVGKDGSETTLDVPSLSPMPPSRIRVPTHLADAALVDVYTLSEARPDGSDAVYRFTATVPRVTDEPAPAQGAPLPLHGPVDRAE